MSDRHFNGLHPAWAEALALLLEELGEAQQAIGKALRHGLDSRHPNGGPDNQESLTKELGDVRAAIHIAASLGIVREHEISQAMGEKLDRVETYLHHIERSAENHQFWHTKGAQP